MSISENSPCSLFSFLEQIRDQYNRFFLFYYWKRFDDSIKCKFIFKIINLTSRRKLIKYLFC